MLNKHISGPKMDPSETRKGQSFQELNEVPILVLYFLFFKQLYMSFRDMQSKPYARVSLLLINHEMHTQILQIRQ